MFGERDGCNQIWICINDQHKKPYFENKLVIFLLHSDVQEFQYNTKFCGFLVVQYVTHPVITAVSTITHFSPVFSDNCCDHHNQSLSLAGKQCNTSSLACFTVFSFYVHHQFSLYKNPWYFCNAVLFHEQDL